MSDELKDMFALDDRGVYDWAKTFGECFPERAPDPEADAMIIDPDPPLPYPKLATPKGVWGSVVVHPAREPNPPPRDLKDLEIARLRADLNGVSTMLEDFIMELSILRNKVVFLNGIDEARERVSLALGTENARLKDELSSLRALMPTAKPEKLQHSDALSRALTFSSIPDGYGRLNTRA